MSAEEAVLSAMMQSAEAVWEVVDVLRPEDFADVRNEILFRTVVDLASAGAPCGPIEVVDALTRAGTVQRAGGAARVHEVHGEVLTWVNVGYHAEIVKRESTRRRLRQAADGVRALAERDGDPSEDAERARDLLDAVTTDERPTVEPIGEALPRVIDSLTEEPRFVPTPWRELNDLVHGFKPGGLHVIAARPGAGKTIMALQSAVDLCAHGAVAFASLEMDQRDLIKRLIAMRATVHMSSVFRSRVSEHDWLKIKDARAAIAEMPLFIDDRSGASLGQIHAFARQVARRQPLAAVVVDYLQLIPSTDSRKSRWEYVGELTRSLKIMARELDVPVVALSQLNRESEKNRRLPTLADLRESGSIEQDADTVVMLQRRVQDKEFTDELDVVVAKNRHGQAGKVKLLWEGQYARLMSPPWVPHSVAGMPDWKAKQSGDD